MAGGLTPFGKIIFPEQSARQGAKMPRIFTCSFVEPLRLGARFEHGPAGAGPYRIYELDCFRSVKALTAAAAI
jgi:hypothetical protein